MEAGNGRGAGLPTLPPPPHSGAAPRPPFAAQFPTSSARGRRERSQPTEKGEGACVRVYRVSPPPHAAPNGETEARRTGGGTKLR